MRNKLQLKLTIFVSFSSPQKGSAAVRGSVKNTYRTASGVLMLETCEVK